MSAKAGRKKKRKPPPRWRRHLVQAELELPPPPASSFSPGDREDPEVYEQELEWWQKSSAAGGLAAIAAMLLVTGYSLYAAHRDRGIAAAAEERAKTLTLRAVTSERPLRINPNPRSFSANPDATIDWPEPPELLDVFLPVAYSDFTSFWLAIDKVDQGRVLVVQRIAPDSNKELRLSLNSSSFGPGEYRIRLQGYTWNGNRVDAGWVRLVVK